MRTRTPRVLRRLQEGEEERSEVETEGEEEGDEGEEEEEEAPELTAEEAQAELDRIMRDHGEPRYE